MRKFALTAALGLAIIGGAGCGEGNKLEQGEIVKMEYDDPDSWVSMQCAGYNANGGCSAQIPITHTDNEHYNLQVVGVDDEGKQRKEWHEVTETLFGLVEVGDTVNFPSMKRVEQ